MTLKARTVDKTLPRKHAVMRSDTMVKSWDHNIWEIGADPGAHRLRTHKRSPWRRHEMKGRYWETWQVRTPKEGGSVRCCVEWGKDRNASAGPENNAYIFEQFWWCLAAEPDCTEWTLEHGHGDWMATLFKKFGRKGSKRWVAAKGGICRMWRWERYGLSLQTRQFWGTKGTQNESTKWQKAGSARDMGGKKDKTHQERRKFKGKVASTAKGCREGQSKVAVQCSFGEHDEGTRRCWCGLRNAWDQDTRGSDCGWIFQEGWLCRG